MGQRQVPAVGFGATLEGISYSSLGVGRLQESSSLLPNVRALCKRRDIWQLSRLSLNKRAFPAANIPE